MTQVGALIEELRSAVPAMRAELASELRELLDGASPPALLDAKAKAAQLGLNPESLVRIAREGRIEGARKVGREWRFPSGGCAIAPANRVSPLTVDASPTARRATDSPAAAAIRQSRKRCA